MRTVKFSAGILAVASFLFSGIARADDRRDLRGDYRDVQRDYARVDQLRADIARDQYQLDQARRYGDHLAAKRISRDLRHDQKALDRQLRDIRRDQRDIRHDQRDLYRDGYYR